MATDNRILALLKVSFFISAFFVGPVFAEGQIVVGSGETYNLEEDQYEGYDNASLNGGVVSVSGTLNVASNVSFKNNKGDKACNFAEITPHECRKNKQHHAVIAGKAIS